MFYNVSLISIPQSPEEKPVVKNAVLDESDMQRVVSEKVDEQHYVMISVANSDISVFD